MQNMENMENKDIKVHEKWRKEDKSGRGIKIVLPYLWEKIIFRKRGNT
jgi:hypothetical protein